MSSETETLGAAGTAAEGGIETPVFRTKEYREAADSATNAWIAIHECRAEDAAQLCAAFLDNLRTEGPRLGDPFGTLTADANLWAEAAPPHELAAYGLAALLRLGKLALGLRMRKLLLTKLWAGLPKRDRMAFLSGLNAEGQFTRKRRA